MCGVFNECDILLKCALLPAESAEPLEAVKKQLNEILLKFNEEVGGIPLMYSSLTFPKGKEYGRIIGENYWVHVDHVIIVSTSNWEIIEWEDYQRTFLFARKRNPYDVLLFLFWVCFFFCIVGC